MTKTFSVMKQLSCILEELRRITLSIERNPTLGEDEAEIYFNKNAINSIKLSIKLKYHIRSIALSVGVNLRQQLFAGRIKAAITSLRKESLYHFNHSGQHELYYS